jgi:hypothetical protein
MPSPSDTRKRSGMSRARAYKMRDKLEKMVDDTYSDVIEYNLPYVSLATMLSMIRETTTWIKAPPHVITHMKGYCSAAYKMLLRTHPHIVPPK